MRLLRLILLSGFLLTTMGLLDTSLHGKEIEMDGEGDAFGDAFGGGYGGFADAAPNAGTGPGVGMDPGLAAFDASMAGGLPDFTFPEVSVIGSPIGVGQAATGSTDTGGFANSFFGKKGINALMGMLGKATGIGPMANVLGGMLGIPGMAPPGQALATGFGSTLGAVLGTSLAGPLGGFLGGQLGGQFGGSFAGAPGAGQGMGPPGASTGNPGGVGMDMLSSLMGLYNARQLANMGRPTGVQSGANAQAQYLLGGGDMSKLPGWQAGQQAITRSMAANGYLGSGNMMKALQDYGGDFYNKTLQTMAGLGQTQPGQYEATVGGMQLQGQAINRMLYDLARMGGTGP